MKKQSNAMLRFTLFLLALASSSYATTQMLDAGVSTTGYVQSGGISTTYISATRISGDGSGLTNVGGTSDRITSGTLAQVIAQTGGSVQVSSTGLYVNYNSANDASVLIGRGATANRSAYADFVGDATYSTYGLRILRSNSGANAPSYIQHRGTGDFIVRTEDAAGLAFQTSSTEHMRISPAGYVGIGTSLPSYPLEVNGRIGAVSLTLNGTAVGTALNNSTILSTLYHSNGNNSYLQTLGLRDSAGTDWTTDGTRIQQYVDATYMGYIQFNGTGNTGGISFGTGLTASPQTVLERMRINSNGYVGIGTTSPANPLDVYGTIRASSTTGYIALIAQTTSATSFADLALQRASDYWWWSNRINGLQLINTQDAGSTYSTPLVVSATTGNVGIGITSPKQRLHVVNSSASTISSAQFGTGTTSLFIGSPIVSSNIYYDGANWRYEATGAGTILNMNAGAFSVFTVASGTAGTVAAPASIMILDSAGNLNIAGNAAKPGGGAWAASSDIRLKNVDADYTSGLAQIIALKPVRFHYKKGNPRHEPTDKQYIGLVAQQAQKIMPETVTTGTDGYLTLDSTPITFALINATRELNTRTEQLTADVAKLTHPVKETNTGIPSGAVMTFDLTSCPGGWSKYTGTHAHPLPDLLYCRKN